MQYIYVFIGGGLGSLCRFLLTKSEISYVSQFPGGTLLSNLISCFILGVVIQMFPANDHPQLKLLLAVGFCGGFSTFSTFSIELFEIIADGKLPLAFAYVLISVVFGLFAIYLGMQLARLL